MHGVGCIIIITMLRKCNLFSTLHTLKYTVSRWLRMGAGVCVGADIFIMMCGVCIYI